MRVSIIIPNYNGEQLLKKNLPQVIEAVNYYQEKTNAQAEIVIVDDDSTDNSVKEVQSASWRTKLKIIKNENNLGFALTVNRGVRESHGEIIVLLNTDVMPEKDFLLPLLKHFKDRKVFAVGCMDKSIENGKIILRGRGIGKWQRGFLVHSRGEIDKTNTLWINGGSGAFRKSIWDKLGGLDSLYSPFYWEDIDLSYRAQKLGYKIIFEPKSVVVHEHEKGVIKSRYSSFQIKTITYRNQFIFVWKNISDLDFLFRHFLWLPYHLLIAIKSLDWAFLVGFMNALVLLSRTIRSRNNSKEFRIKKDNEIIKEFTE